MFFYRIPEPNQALVISGSKGGADGAQFRIVTGHGTFVAPWRSRARILSLDLYESELEENCVTSQGIPLTVQAVAVFKVADDFQSIANAARRFLDQQDQMESLVGQILAGHLRSIVGGLTVEKIITDRNSLAQEVKGASSDEMEKLGLIVDAFQIQEVGDPSGYIKNLAAPHIAEVEKNARIAQAQADQAATEREQEANAQKAGFTRDSEIKQAGARAEVQAAQAEADQSGPLAQAKAAQKVTEEQAALAAKQAEKREAELVAEVQKPADAEAYKTIKLAEAQRDAMRAQADALTEGNLERIVASRLVDMMPAIVASLAQGLNGANLSVVNGAEGVSQVVTGLVASGRSIYDALLSTVPGTAPLPAAVEPASADAVVVVPSETVGTKAVGHDGDGDGRGRGRRGSTSANG
jgi:flotillin